MIVESDFLIKRNTGLRVVKDRTGVSVSGLGFQRDLAKKTAPPGADVKFKSTKSKRFSEMGENATHPLTVRMREIKDGLLMTTRQLVRGVNEYEKSLKSKPSAKRDVSSSYLPLNTVLLSSYLQGQVMQHSFIEAICSRLEAFNTYMQDRPGVHRSKDGMREIMDKWFSQLGIATDDPNISPFRHFAKLIEPHYKRAVFSDVAGIFILGEKIENLQVYTIKNDEGVIHSYLLNPAEPLLVANGAQVQVGTVLQYATEISASSDKSRLYAVCQEKGINQSSFYRWYTMDKMPRSSITVQNIQEAVNKVV